MKSQNEQGCVAFPHLRAEHLAKDVFQFPEALFGKGIVYITRKCDDNLSLPLMKVISGDGAGDKFNVREAFAVARECSKFRHAVLFHVSYITFLIALLIKVFSSFRRGARTRVILQSDVSPKYAEIFASRAVGAAKPLFWLGRQFSRFLFDAVSVASERGGRFLNNSVGIPREKTFTIYNCPHFDGGAAHIQSEARSTRKKQILFIGRKDDPAKNMPNLIAAFEIVSERYPHWTLELVGPGKLYPSKLNNFSIHQVGSVTDRGEILNKYKTSKIFLMPSLPHEGASLAFVEALINGCYPVVTDAGNFCELVNKVGAGVIVGLDPESIAVGIFKAIEFVEMYPDVHEKIQNSAKFLEWGFQVRELKEYLCLN